jgi:nicotinamide riboside kinase
MKRIAILGTASSGKTTLAAALAQRFGTVWVPEYLREFVDSGPRAGGGGPDSTSPARSWSARPAAPRAQHYLLRHHAVDDGIYSRHYFGGIDAQLAPLADAIRSATT